MLIISGLVKTYKNIYAPDISHTVVLWATWIHNIFFVLFFLAFLAHMAAIALKPNWPLVRGIFTGRVRLDYARHRHPLWLADIEQKSGGTEIDKTGQAAGVETQQENAPSTREKRR